LSFLPVSSGRRSSGFLLKLKSHPQVAVGSAFKGFGFRDLVLDDLLSGVSILALLRAKGRWLRAIFAFGFAFG
jgi:hypothetical protein